MRDPQQLSIVCRRALQSIDRRHSQIGHQLKFLCVLSVRKNRRVRAEGNFHANFEGVPKHLRARVVSSQRFRLQCRRITIEFALNIFRRHQRRRQERSLVFHQRQRFRFEKRTVLDRIDPSLDRFASRLIAMAMHRHLFS